jgi:hypothetical protein
MAVRKTRVPPTTCAEQTGLEVAPQLIPPPVTVPDPLPLVVTDKVKMFVGTHVIVTAPVEP